MKKKFRQSKYYEDWIENCDILDDYFIETKYPANPPIDYSPQETEKAIKLAEETLEFVDKKIGSKVSKREKK